MSLTENLKPCDESGKKRTVREPAMRAVAARAHNATDARDLLEHLGLIEPRTPKARWRRANKPRAAS